jgi:hypothetical protein
MNTTTQTQVDMVSLTNVQRAILMECVGLDKAAHPYRNAYVVSMLSAICASADDMVASGLMTRDHWPLRAECWWYRVTPEGEGAARWAYMAAKKAKERSHDY